MLYQLIFISLSKLYCQASNNTRQITYFLYNHKIMTLKNKKDCSNSNSMDVDTLTLDDPMEESFGS